MLKDKEVPGFLNESKVGDKVKLAYDVKNNRAIVSDPTEDQEIGHIIGTVISRNSGDIYDLLPRKPPPLWRWIN